MNKTLPHRILCHLWEIWLHACKVQNAKSSIVYSRKQLN